MVGSEQIEKKDTNAQNKYECYHVKPENKE